MSRERLTRATGSTSCDNVEVTKTQQEGPLWQRLLLAVTVALSVVGMHHLTSVACSQPVAHHEVVHVAAAKLLTDSPERTPDSNTAVQDLTPGVACLALLIAVGVVLRAMRGFAARRRDLLEAKHEATVSPRIEDPPDLHILSISRT